MSTMELLISEVEESPNAMIEELLDFARFLKSGRFASNFAGQRASEDIDVIYDKPRTITDLANEQRAFQASLPSNLVDIDLP